MSGSSRRLSGGRRHQRPSGSDHNRRLPIYPVDMRSHTTASDDDNISLFSHAPSDNFYPSPYSTPPNDVEGPFPVPLPERSPSGLASRAPSMSNALVRVDSRTMSMIGMAITHETEESQDSDAADGNTLHPPKELLKAEALLRRMRSKIDSAAEQKKEASRTEAQLSAELDEAKKKIASLEGEKRTLASDLNSARNRIGALEGKETQLNADLNNAKGRVETLSASESRLKIELQSTTKEVGTLRDVNGKLEVQLEEEKRRADRNEDLLKTTETRLKNDLERGKKDMESLRDSKSKVVAERDALRKELDAYRAMIEKRMMGIYKLLLDGDKVLDDMGCQEREGFEFPESVPA